uniref:Reverse transcriptase Ty1/copia-type domain-containing protein n=1 Tax=Tanacetum cinerariifolium TaxID=118510 RepID=A0A6L2NT78_TANCI|nr:hypothetical protein [Tanacetum cinerariifolium]
MAMALKSASFGLCVDLPALKVVALIAKVVAPEPAASTGSPSSTTVDQDAPSPKNDSEAPSSSDVIPTIVQTAAPNSEHVNKWTKDHPLDNIIGELRRPVSTRLQLYEQALFCYYDAFLSSVKPKTYKDALTQACWIEAMQEDQPNGFVDKDNLNHVYKLKKALYGLKQAFHAWQGKDILLVQIYVDDIIFASTTPELCDQFSKITCSKFNMSMMGKITFFLGLQISQSPRGIFLNQSKYALESLKKYGIESSDPVDTPMVEKSKLNKDPQGKAVNPTHYREMVVTLMYLTASRPDLTFNVCMYARFHFIKEQVENRVVELYFVNTEYQLVEIFTKALCRERIESLINKLGMQSFTPETLKQLADESEE